MNDNYNPFELEDIDEALKLKSQQLGLEPIEPIPQVNMEALSKGIEESGYAPGLNAANREAELIEQKAQQKFPEEATPVQEEQELPPEEEKAQKEDSSQLPPSQPEAPSVRQEFTKDSVYNYIRDKYGLARTPEERSRMEQDTSYDTLTKQQKRSGILGALSEFDTALGQLGSEKILDAERAGFKVSPYKGGALGRLSQQELEDLKAKQAFADKDFARQKEGLGLDKAAFDFATLSQDEEIIGNANSPYSKFVREFVKDRLNINIPENVSAKMLFKAQPFLASAIKPETKNTQIIPGKDEQGKPTWLLVDKNTGKTTPVAEIDRAKRVMTDPEGNIVYIDPEQIAAQSGLANKEISIPGVSPASGGTTGKKTVVDSSRQLNENVSLEQKQNQPLTKQMRKELDTVAEPYFKDVVQKANSAYNDILGVKDSIVLARDGSKIADAVLKVQVAKRVLGEVGNLAQHDKAGLTESQALLDQVEAALKKLQDGGMTETNIAEVEKAIKMYEARSLRALNREYQGFRESTSQMLGIYPERLDKIYQPRIRTFQDQQSQRGQSGLTPDERKARIEELRRKKGN